MIFRDTNVVSETLRKIFPRLQLWIPTSASIQLGRIIRRLVVHGGSADNLTDIIDVKIISNNGKVLIDGALNIFCDTLRDIAGGVKFFVMKPDDSID